MAAHGAPATLRDVARLAGVSPATVSNVMQNRQRVAEGTRERVRAAASALNYEPNPLARSLRSGRTGMVALIIPDLRNAYFAELASELSAAAARHGLRISLELLHGDRKHEEATLTGVWSSHTDGILYVPQDLAGKEIDDVLDSRTGRRAPVVLLGERGAGASCAQVTYRNADAARAVVEALLAGGARRIATIGPHERAGSATPRLEGYLAALAAAGLPVQPELIRQTNEWHRAAGQAAMRALLADGVAFDGVFAFNDMLALGALAALAEAGIRVPEDVQVVGFDDVEEASFATPALTTVDPGKRAAAELALSLLMELQRGDADADVGMTPEFAVVRRGTTHPPVT